MKDASWGKRGQPEPPMCGPLTWGLLELDASARPGLVATTARLWDAELLQRSAGTRAKADLDELAALVVLGVSKRADPPAERLIEQAIRRDLPVLAIGSAARLLAAILGAPARETALHDSASSPVLASVFLTDDGCVDRVLGAAPSPIEIVHRDLDGFDLPRGATPLAWSPATAAQAFRFGRAYGLPFHLEVDAEIAERWSLRGERAVPSEATLRAGLAVFGMFARLVRTVRSARVA